MGIKFIYGVGYQVFMKQDSYGFKVMYEEGCHDLINVFLKIYPEAKKTDILELLEYMLMCIICSGDSFQESDEILWFPLSKDSKGYGENGVCFNEPIPSFEAEYIEILGQIFLAGYVDFVIEEEIGNNQYKDAYLSNYKEDKYQAWIYFRDNFFYKGSYNRDYTDIKRLYKDITPEKYVYSTWDTPEYWDMYRFWVARTPKGTKYFNEILAPRFYNKYKDLEVEIDEKGNIIFNG